MLEEHSVQYHQLLLVQYIVLDTLCAVQHIASFLHNAHQQFGVNGWKRFLLLVGVLVAEFDAGLLVEPRANKNESAVHTYATG